MRGGGIWLTAFIRGCKLEILTEFSRGTTAPIFYIPCYALLNLKIMSQLNDIKKAFISFSEEYGWSKEETAKNMNTILSCCEWGLPIEDVLDENGEVDYIATSEKKTEYVYKLLWC